MVDLVPLPLEADTTMLMAGSRAFGGTIDGRPVWKLTTDVQAGAVYRAMVEEARRNKASAVTWRGTGIPVECPYPPVGRWGAPWGYNIDPGAGSAADRLQRDWPRSYQIEDLHERDGSVTPLYPLRPQALKREEVRALVLDQWDKGPEAVTQALLDLQGVPR